MNLLRDLLGRARREADLMPAQMRREGIAFRFVPLLVVGLFTAALQLGPSADLIMRNQLATVGLVVALIASLFLAPWRRLPRWTQAIPPLLGIVIYLAVLGSPDYRITYSPVLLVPILWLALYYTWVELTVGLALVLGFSLLHAFVDRVPLPELVIQAGYAAVSALAFYSVHIVVQRIRNYAIDVTIVGRLLHEVASVTDSHEARMAICDGVNRVCWASQARLYELDTDRNLVATAGAAPGDLAALPVQDVGASGATTAVASGHPAVRAFLTGQPIFTGDASQGSPEWLGGRQRSALWHPVLRNGVPVGVLATSWSWRVYRMSAREAASVSIFASEAAVIIERADLVRQLSVMVRTDPVTGLANRRAWDTEISGAMARAVRAGQPLCVAVLDLDHFKAYNDDWGHDRGDRLLHDAASAWRAQLREVDMLARFGGDEFGLLLPNCPLEEAVRVMERLSQATPDGQRCSAGIAWWDSQESAEDVVARADAALYESKRSERGSITTAGTTSDPSLKHWTMLVPELLRTRAMMSVYQPICDINDRRPVGYEALARPVGEDAGISVEALFAAAHRMGAWRDLDWLCRRLAVENARWMLPNQLLFVNVGVRALLDPVHDTDQMLMLMQWANRSPSTVVLEISEREPVSDLGRFREVISSYRREGFRFALDDVGEGHSTLETMAAANPEFIKVARSLTVQSMIGAHRAVIRALVEFGRSNGAQVIAEGVETEAHLDNVRELGVDLGQGYALGRPAVMNATEPPPPEPAVSVGQRTSWT
jgi:diguanylate cyclase (GGDEF)-like protein